MARSKMDYNGYRGRKTVADVLRLIAIVLLVLVLLAAGVLIFGQRYIVYQDGKLTLDFPFSDNSPSQSVPDPGDVSVVVRPEEKSEQPAEEETAMGAITVSIQAILDGSAETLAQQAGADAVIVDMKTDQGSLNWKSEQAIARNVKANSTVEGINEAIAAFNARTQLYTIARMSCFRDQLVGSDWGCAVISTGKTRWEDDQGIRWSTAQNSAVRTYLAKAAGELAQMGFDEILLDYAGTPSRGDTSKIPEETLMDSTSEEKFLDEMQQELKTYNVVLSCRTEQSVFETEVQQTSLTAQMLDDYFDRLWIEASPGEDLTARLEQSGLKDAKNRVVELVKELTPERSVPQAVLSPEVD